MAAGDIITSKGYIFTPEDIAMFTSPIQERIATTAKDPGEFELVESLQGISSLPVFFQSGASYRLVRVAVSILRGVDGQEVHLQVSEAGYIQWRWSDGMWQNLIALADLKGDKGETPTFRTGTSGIEWKYLSEGEDAWKMLVSYDVLKLKFSDLTAEQIAEFWRQIPADVLALFQQPAVDAAARADEKLVQISEDVNQLIADTEEVKDRADKSASDADAARISLSGSVQQKLTEVDNKMLTVKDGKTIQFEIGTVESGADPAATLTDNGTDISGNPKKKLNFVFQEGPKGDNAKSPAVQTGTIVTGDPGSEVSFSFTEIGTSEDGRPIWRADGSIPRGQKGLPGEGSGNVSAIGTGLLIGKKYLFVPESDGSTSGKFDEYVAPNMPEQTQPDWSATEGKGEILNKPTIPDVPEWALRPEAPDSFPEAPVDDKTYGRKNNTWVEVNVDQIVNLPVAIFSLDPSTATSDQIKQALGGDDAFKKLLEDIAGGKTLVLSIPGDATIILGTVTVHFASEEDLSQVLSFDYAGVAIVIMTTSVYDGIYSFEFNDSKSAFIVENGSNLDEGFYVIHRASGSNYLSKQFRIPTIKLPLEFLNLNNDSTNEEIAIIFNAKIQINNGYSTYDIRLFDILKGYLTQSHYFFIPVINTNRSYPYRPIPIRGLYESGDFSIVIEYALNGVEHKVTITLNVSYSVKKESHSMYPTISALAPTSADGNDGDIWIQYSN